MPEDPNDQEDAGNIEIRLAAPQTVFRSTFLVIVLCLNSSPYESELRNLNQILHNDADKTPNEELAAQLQAIFLQHFEEDDQIEYREDQLEVVVVYPSQVVNDE